VTKLITMATCLQRLRTGYRTGNWVDVGGTRFDLGLTEILNSFDSLLEESMKVVGSVGR
jgi:hypothetical protein